MRGLDLEDRNNEGHTVLLAAAAGDDLATWSYCNYCWMNIMPTSPQWIIKVIAH